MRAHTFRDLGHFVGRFAGARQLRRHDRHGVGIALAALLNAVLELREHGDAAVARGGIEARDARERHLDRTLEVRAPVEAGELRLEHVGGLGHAPRLGEQPGEQRRGAGAPVRVERGSEGGAQLRDRRGVGVLGDDGAR